MNLRIWRWPLLIGVLTAAGLIVALVGDGWADVASWWLLGVPVAGALYGAVSGRRGTRR